MKTSTALVFLAIVAGCLAKMTPEEIAEKCKKEVGFTDGGEQDKDESKEKCYLKCLLETPKLIDADGTPNCDNAAKIIAEETSDETVRQEFVESCKKCADKTNESQETDPCEKGAIIFHCMSLRNKEIREKGPNSTDS